MCNYISQCLTDYDFFMQHQLDLPSATMHILSFENQQLLYRRNQSFLLKKQFGNCPPRPTWGDDT
jgi:hypothetical protein